MKKVQNYCCLFVFVCSILTAGCEESMARNEPSAPAIAAKPKAESVNQMSSPKTSQATPSAVKGPKIHVTNEFHDFGQVGPGTYNTCEFSFKNIGTEKLIIEKVQSTCGCSVPELKKKEFAPGESGEVTVRFHAPSNKGETKKQLYILSNDPSNPRARIELAATVVVNVEVEPETMTLALDKPNAGLMPLTIRSLDGKEFSITKFTSPNNVITSDFDPGKKAKEFVLHPVVDKEKLTKFLNGTMQIDVDHPQGGRLLVRYTTLPQYEVNRPRIIIQNAKKGQKEKKEVIITANYGNTLEIASSSSRLGYMEIVDKEIEGNALKLTIEISMPKENVNNKRYFSDELIIKFENDQEVSIRVSGWFRQ